MQITVTDVMGNIYNIELKSVKKFHIDDKRLYMETKKGNTILVYEGEDVHEYLQHIRAVFRVFFKSYNPPEMGSKEKSDFIKYLSEYIEAVKNAN